MHLAPLIQDLAIILGLAAVTSLIFRRLKQPVVLGYILAGLIVSPHTPGIRILDYASVKVWAELGVIFLMFSLGLEFSFRRLLQIGPTAVINGVIEITIMLVMGYSAANFLGWSHNSGLFLGGMVAISSTTIIVKAFDELQLRGRRFADVVLGILIIEDIAAILILVVLSSFATGNSDIGPWFVGQAILKLFLVVGSWFFVGMVMVPRFLKTVVRYGTHEMLTLTAVALCLGLVALAASFEYSVALGAFMMGSILAETRDGQKVDHLVAPLKDLFGAVFFVSVGMLVDPAVLMRQWKLVLLITAMVLIGKLFAVHWGALAAGQSRKNAVRISFSMAQIGEFSFIIATLGLTLGVLAADVYPVIIFASLLTTFMTPYLMRAAEPFANLADRHLPTGINRFFDGYAVWMERRLSSPTEKKVLYNAMLRWVASVVVITAIFAVVKWLVQPSLSRFPWLSPEWVDWVAWLIAMLAASPFVGAMLFTGVQWIPGNSDDHHHPLHSGRSNAWIGGVAATLLVGILSQRFLSFYVSFGLTLVMVLVLGFFLRRRIITRYHWFEKQFLAGFSAGGSGLKSPKLAKSLSPWGAQLTEVEIAPESPALGKSLEELGLREKFGVNVICIQRGDRLIAPPVPKERLFPMDQLLVFGEEAGIAAFLREYIETQPSELPPQTDMESYQIYILNIEDGHSLCGKTIRQSRLREDHSSIVVGLERQGQRIQNPHSDTRIEAGDALWIVGDKEKVESMVASW